MYLIKDIWKIVFKYLDNDIKSYPEFFETHLDKLGWEGMVYHYLFR